MKHEIQPIWTKISHIPKLFGVGKDLVAKWRREGVILCRAHKNSVQVCVASVHNVMILESCGQKPLRLNRDSLVKQAKAASYALSQVKSKD